VNYSFFRIATRSQAGELQWYTFPMVMGETIRWEAKEAGRVSEFVVLIDLSNMPTSVDDAMACIMYRNNKRLTMRPLDTRRSAKFLQAIFESRDPEDHDVSPGDTFRVRFERVTDLDLASKAQCEFCGGTTVRVAGEDTHEEPVCEPWMERERKRAAKSWN